MQDLFGDQWKEKLNNRGRKFVKDKENGREKYGLKCGFTMDTPIERLARDDEYPALWHKNVERFKRRLLQKSQSSWVKKEAISEAQKAQSQA